jgi:hypothetical protein
MEVTIPVTVLLEVLAFVAGLAVIWGTIRTDMRQMRRECDALAQRMTAAEAGGQRVPQLEMRVTAVEGLAAKVDRIDPLIERVSQFERHMGEKVDGLARTLDDLRTLLFKAAAKSGA